ncbi:YxeA family protein [Lactobacillus intestinalis]|uniref:YxeA family protein n=1 Tax=Lactobacillus intestinalis TaxID=151781 RepID=UPI00070B48B4|nr:YxeA family protein [Lactobacillus intestinalis]UTW40690.1 YxeA family protein [Lactobacillus intestinalis]
MLKKLWEFRSIIVVVILGCLLISHTAVFDRFNPFISETVSYAQVPTGTQKYKNVKIYNHKITKLKSYRLHNVGGYDPSREYISIRHRGQYVKSIKYISKKDFVNKVK